MKYHATFPDQHVLPRRREADDADTVDGVQGSALPRDGVVRQGGELDGRHHFAVGRGLGDPRGGLCWLLIEGSFQAVLM